VFTVGIFQVTYTFGRLG